MAFLQRTVGVLMLFIFGGAIFGGLLGQGLSFFAHDGLLKDVFLKSYPIGIAPPLTIDLFLITFTIGFTLRVDLMILLGILLGIYTYKQT
jgi:hypothetical protein